MINILDFSADPTRTSDSHLAIQSAIDAADAQGHGVVVIPPGDYLIRQTIIMPQGVTLVGEGSKGNSFRSRIISDQPLDSLISFHKSHSSGLRGVYLDGNYVVRRVVSATDTWGLRIKDCYIRKPIQDGTGAGLWGGALLYPDIHDTVFGTINTARGIDIVESNYDEAGYYGANVGSITRCQIHCKMSSIKFSGQIIISENDIEGQLWDDLAVIELGEHSHGHVTIRDNYFEVRQGGDHKLRAMACYAPPGGLRVFNNIIFGDTAAVDSVAIDIDPKETFGYQYAYPCIIRDNSILRWKTGIRAQGPSCRAAVCENNSFQNVELDYDANGFAPGMTQNSYHGRRFNITGTGGSYSNAFVGNADGGMCECHAWTRHVRPQDTNIDLQSGRNFEIDLADCPTMTHSNALPGMEFVISFKQGASFLDRSWCAGDIARFIVMPGGEIVDAP